MKLDARVLEKRFAITPLALAGVYAMRRRLDRDSRGQFSRLFCAQELAELGWPNPVAQVNLSVTERAGTVRGLHFQRDPAQETKLVQCVQGRVWDVVVDLRPHSSSFGQWVGRTLDAALGDGILIPSGCAHGFQALENHAALVYMHSVPHAPELQGGVHALDPELAIDWPLPVALMSDRDRSLPMLSDL